MTLLRHGALGALLLLASLAARADAAPRTAASLHPLLQNPCGQTIIRAPKQGDALQGSIPIYGSARIDDFNFYKLEYSSAASPENWFAVSSTKPSPVVGGYLDIWDTAVVTDGQYYLKLTVVDSVGQETCRFIVGDLYVANRGTPTLSPTPTPEESPTATATPTTPSDTSVETDQPVGAEEAPTAEATVTLIEPITPLDDDGGGLFSVEGILDALAIGRLVGGFAKGFILVFSLLFVAAFVAWLRNG